MMSMDMGGFQVPDQRQTQRQTQRCRHCKQEGGKHKSDCPQERINQLQSAIDRRIEITDKGNCPDCKAVDQLEPNTSDYFECRRCHTQFVCTGNGAQEDLVELELNKGNSLRLAYRLPEKGRGEFKLDRDNRPILKRIADIKRINNIK